MLEYTTSEIYSIWDTAQLLKRSNAEVAGWHLSNPGLIHQVG